MCSSDLARLQVPPPHLTGPIGKAEMQMHASGRKRALKRDDLQVALQDRGPALAGTLEGGPGEVSHDPEHKSADIELSSQGFQAETDIATRSEVEGNRAQGLDLHGTGPNWPVRLGAGWRVAQHARGRRAPGPARPV